MIWHLPKRRICFEMMIFRTSLVAQTDFVWCCQSVYLNPNHHIFLNLTSWFCCLNLTKLQLKNEKTFFFFKQANKKDRRLHMTRVTPVSWVKVLCTHSATTTYLLCSHCCSLCYVTWLPEGFLPESPYISSKDPEDQLLPILDFVCAYKPNETSALDFFFLGSTDWRSLKTL